MLASIPQPSRNSLAVAKTPIDVYDFHPEIFRSDDRTKLHVYFKRNFGYSIGRQQVLDI